MNEHLTFSWIFGRHVHVATVSTVFRPLLEEIFPSSLLWIVMTLHRTLKGCHRASPSDVAFVRGITTAVTGQRPHRERAATRKLCAGRRARQPGSGTARRQRCAPIYLCRRVTAVRTGGQAGQAGTFVQRSVSRCPGGFAPPPATAAARPTSTS